jgi:hypothetical protein
MNPPSPYLLHQVLQFLYSSGEAQRILYKVIVINTIELNNPLELFTKLSSISTAKYYRIILVSSISLVGLISLMLASIIITGMMVYT